MTNYNELISSSIYIIIDENNLLYYYQINRPLTSEPSKSLEKPIPKKRRIDLFYFTKNNPHSVDFNAGKNI